MVTRCHLVALLERGVSMWRWASRESLLDVGGGGSRRRALAVDVVVALRSMSTATKRKLGIPSVLSSRHRCLGIYSVCVVC